MGSNAPRDFAFCLLQMFDVGHELAYKEYRFENQVGGQAVLGRQGNEPTPWLTERHGYDPTLLLVC